MSISRLFFIIAIIAAPLSAHADVEQQIDNEELLDALRVISEMADDFARTSEIGVEDLKDRTDEEIFKLYDRRPDLPEIAIEAATRYLRLGRTTEALQVAETLNIVYPTVPALRAFYGTLLIKSKQLAEAQEQLVILRSLAKTAEDVNAAETLQSLIDDEVQPGRLNGFMSIGIGHTDNAGLEEDGNSSLLATGLLALDGTYRLGAYGSPHALFGGLFGLGNRPLEQKEERLNAVGLSAGHQYSLDNGAVFRSLVTGGIVNDGDGQVRRSPGLSFRYRHVLPSGRSTMAQVNVKYDDYTNDIDQGKDGWRFFGRLTSSYPLTNSLLASLSASVEREEKDSNSDSYWTGSLAAALTVPVAKGFLRGAVIGRLSQADDGISEQFSTERTKDLLFNLDLSVPANTIIEGAPEGLGQRIFYIHGRNYSNLEGDDYQENRIVLSTFYRF